MEDVVTVSNFFPCHMTCRILVLRLGIKPTVLGFKALSPNTTGPPVNFQKVPNF